MRHWVMALALTFPCATLAADWEIDNQESRVSFVTIKQGNIAEVSRFAAVEGTLNEKGQFTLAIPLIGVQTGIDIRDERMQKMLFEVAKYPALELDASVDMQAIDSIKPGSQALVTVDAQVALHGKQQPMTIEVMVSRLNKKVMTVSSFQPLVVNAAVFDLGGGVEKLREVAGLKAISEAVPVSFVLTLTQP